MLAIAGGKGGCGKTTTALGLAAALARRHDEFPVVADADRDSPDLHLLADVAPSTDRDDVRGDRPLEPVAFETDSFPGVSVVPAPPGTVSDGRFQARLDRLSTRDSSTLVDCPPGAGRDAVAPLRACDAVLLATTLAPASLRDAAKTAAMANQLGADLAGAVLTRVPAWASTDGDQGRSRSDSDYVEVRSGIVRRVERLLDAPVVGHVPEVDRTDRPVLAHPVVRASYERLARAVRR